MTELDLIARPLAGPEDLGKPIPGWPHATSVCIPTWQDSIDYEEGVARVIDRLQCGYPRFVYHPFVTRLVEFYQQKLSWTDRCCLAFPSRNSAERCQALLVGQQDSLSELHEIAENGVTLLSLPTEFEAVAASYWQHTGEGISSRLAEATMNPGTKDQVSDAGAAKTTIRERIAKKSGVPATNVYLFPSGMSAIFNIHMFLSHLRPDRKSVQFGFPYVDTLKIQQKYGLGVHFLHCADDADITALGDIVKSEGISGLFCEFPMNPLMNSPNLSRLAELARQYQFPLVVDDTIGTYENVSLFPPADVIVTSLTKFFSGIGDVMAGAAVLNPDGSFYSGLRQEFDQNYVDNLWCDDAVALERNSRDFVDRITKINATTERVGDFLNCHPAVDHVYYPKFETPDFYRAYRRTSEAGYGGVLSLLVRDAAKNSSRLFDNLKINKGPSLGTNFSLACPYTILAHYNELEFAENCGISRYLIRVSIGLEDADDLIDRFAHALSFVE